MPEPLTDDELLAVADDPMWAPKLTSEERRRLVRVRASAKPEAQPSSRDETMLRALTSPLGKAAEPVIGFANEVGERVATAGQALSRLPGVGSALSAIGFTPDTLEVARQRAQPVNAGQRAGATAENMLEFAAPVGLAGRGGRIAQAAGGAAEFGAKSALQGNSTRDVATDAVIGGATPAASELLSKAGNVITKKLPERLYGQIFKNSPDDMRAQFESVARGQERNPTLAKEVLQRGISGSSETMAVDVYKNLNVLEDELQASAKGTMTTLPQKPKFIKLLRDIKGTFKGTFFAERGQEADELIRSLQSVRGDAVHAEDALKVKRYLDRMRNTSSFRMDPKLTVKQEELKVAADTVRNSLKQNPTFRTLLNEERIHIQAFDDIVDDAVRRNNKQLLGLTDYILGGGGMAAGAGVSGIGTAAMVRGFQQPTTLTGMGQALYKTGKAMPAGMSKGLAKGTTAALASRPKDEER